MPRKPSFENGRPWAAFLDGKDLSRFSHKQLQGACKKARLKASGSAIELCAHLQECINCSTPPEWYLKAEAAKSLRVVEEEPRLVMVITNTTSATASMRRPPMRVTMPNTAACASDTCVKLV